MKSVYLGSSSEEEEPKENDNNYNKKNVKSEFTT